MKELKTLESFIRELMMNPTVPVYGENIRTIVTGLLDRPVEGNLPDIEILRAVLLRILSDPERVKELEQTSFKPGIALMNFLLQTANLYLAEK